MQLNWHANNPALNELCLLDRDPADAEIDLAAVRAYRLGRVREQMAERSVDACLLFDPVNIRYATGSRNMQVFSARNPARYLFLPASGPVVLFEFTGCEHLADDLETIDEVRPAITASFVAAGPAIAERERLWARETAALIREYCGADATVGIERVNAGACVALTAEGFHTVDAQHPVELARAVKSEEEMKCVRSSIRATERTVEQLRAAVAPGLTEQQLWSILHQGVIAQGGDYIETRLLSAGERTNPWFQEAGDNVIGPNELVALDTDVVGCFGYYCDFSRTFHSGPDKPSEKQKTLYKVSLEQLHHNMNIIRAGVSFKEYSELAWDIPERYTANRYYLSAHGVGMTGEYPYLYHRMDYPHAGYDGVIKTNMTICVESYIGEEGGREGVKLEQHCLVTEDGIEVLSQFPFEDSLMDDSVHGTPDLRLVSNDTHSRQSPARGDDFSRDTTTKTVPATSQPLHSQPLHPINRRTWSTRTPAGSTRDDAVLVEPLTRNELIQRIDLTLPGPDTSTETIVRLCKDARQCGITFVSVPSSLVRDAVAALSLPSKDGRKRNAGVASAAMSSKKSHPESLPHSNPNITIGATIRLPDSTGAPADQVRALRQAMHDGARAVDIILGPDALRAQSHQSTLVKLRRLVHEARDSRAWTTVVIECGHLTESEQVVAAKLAARVRPDVIATGSGVQGDGSDIRQVLLVREAAGPRPIIRAMLAPDGEDAEALIDAGAARLGVTGFTEADSPIRSAS